MLAYRVDRCGDMQVGEVLETHSLEFNIPELNRSFAKKISRWGKFSWVELLIHYPENRRK